MYIFVKVLLFSTIETTHKAYKPKILDPIEYFLIVKLSLNNRSMVKDTLEIIQKKN